MYILSTVSSVLKLRDTFGLKFVKLTANSLLCISFEIHSEKNNKFATKALPLKNISTEWITEFLHSKVLLLNGSILKTNLYFCIKTLQS